MFPSKPRPLEILNQLRIKDSTESYSNPVIQFFFQCLPVSFILFYTHGIFCPSKEDRCKLTLESWEMKGIQHKTLGGGVGH